MFGLGFFRKRLFECAGARFVQPAPCVAIRFAGQALDFGAAVNGPGGRDGVARTGFPPSTAGFSSNVDPISSGEAVAVAPQQRVANSLAEISASRICIHGDFSNPGGPYGFEVSSRNFNCQRLCS